MSSGVTFAGATEPDNVWLYHYNAADRLSAALDLNHEPYLLADYGRTGRVVRAVAEMELTYHYHPDKTIVENRSTGERQVFERDAAGAVVGFFSTSGIAWQLSLDQRGRPEMLRMSAQSARLLDMSPDAFRPDRLPSDKPELRTKWSRTVRFVYSPGGLGNNVATTEATSSWGREYLHYEYDERGRLITARSSTGGIPPLLVCVA